MQSPRTPSYSLGEIKIAVRRGRYLITHRAGRDAADLYLDEEDITDCVLALSKRDFYKTMQSRQQAGMNQDVYKPRYGGFSIYLKLQLSRERAAVVISFKRDESA